MHITISHFFAVSVLLGCSCCSTVDETLENVARRLGSRMKKEKSHWAAGRVGDIDFLGPTKTRGKVRLDVITSKESNITRVCSSTGILTHHVPPCLQSVCEGAQQHRPSADLPDADRRVGSCSSTPGGCSSGRR